MEQYIAILGDSEVGIPFSLKLIEARNIYSANNKVMKSKDAIFCSEIIDYVTFMKEVEKIKQLENERRNTNSK